MKEKRGIRKIKKIEDPSVEQFIKDVDIGGTQSNVGTLGLTQPERKVRFEKPIQPDDIEIKRNIESMRGDKEPEWNENGNEEPRTESENEPGNEIS